MGQIFGLHAINVVERVGRYDIYIGHEKGRVQLRIGNTSRYVTAGNAALVQQIAIGSDRRVAGLAARDMDCPARNILFVAFVGKKRDSGGVVSAPPSHDEKRGGEGKRENG